MPEPTPEHRLARAFLALSDEPEPPRRPTLGAVVCAVAAAVALALAAPLAWASGWRVDQPAATKHDVALAADEDEDGGDGGPPSPPDDDGTDGKTVTGGDTWAATDA